jgi:serine/threonine protein kinase
MIKLTNHVVRDNMATPNISKTKTLAQVFHRFPKMNRSALRGWSIAIGGVILFAALGVWMHGAVKAKMRLLTAETLETILEANTNALEIWISNEREEVSSWSKSPTIVRASELLRNQEVAEDDVRAALLSDPNQQMLLTELQGVTEDEDVFGFAIISQSGVILCCNDQSAIGNRVSAEGMAKLIPAFTGKTLMVRPFLDEALDDDSGAVIEEPLMAFVSGIGPADGNTELLLVFLVDPEKDFTGILSVGAWGKSGNTYAFDEDGLLLSHSRFTDQLQAAEMIPKGEPSILRIEIRDPGGDIRTGFRPTTPMAARPMTKMAASAIQGETGMDTAGYRDYRGVEVIGAWKWLPEVGMGVATEISKEEMNDILRPIRTSYGLLAGMVAIAGAGYLFKSWNNYRLRMRIDEVRQLGQYTLTGKIGEGGMGQVYKARHAMLRRPTAIKLLPPGNVNEETIARFEREVQLTSELTHPNTIEIYDFGRTPEGVFYYAMEYLDGLTLADLLRVQSPLPPERVVHILRQACGSLAEAHSIGLVHRDIKPLNIILCKRGGRQDVVKVLDFGLVKDVSTPEDLQVTSEGFIAGTPMYMAPERIRDPKHVDARSDLFAIGAVGFQLLTGREVFLGASAMEVCNQVLHAPAPQVQGSTAQPVSDELNALIDACLAKYPDDRPQSAMTIIEALDAVPEADRWTSRDADHWWAIHAPAIEDLKEGSKPEDHTDDITARLTITRNFARARNEAT